MAAQERETKHSRTVADSVGAVAVVTMVAVAVTAPAVTASVVVAVAAAVVVQKRRGTVDAPSMADTRDRPRGSHGPTGAGGD